MSNKKYDIIHTIEPDAPFGYINYITISFLTPQKEEKTKYLDVIGFKVHNGYTIEELASSDAKRLKTINNKHDIYPLEMGKLYPWDDITKTENVEYDDKKLNDLEKTRRENADKLKLMREQFKNEHLNSIPNNTNSRMQEQLKKMRQKLYKEGKITQKELELMEETNKPLSEIKIEAEAKARLEREAEEAFQVDLLDVNESVPLKFGLISIFTPKTIGNLKDPCFKIRGLFQMEEEMNERKNYLEKLYPKDQIYRFEIGKWCPYSDKAIDGDVALKQLNYAMKCHLDTLSTEAEEFEKRKSKMMDEAKTEAKATKIKNRKEKRKQKREKAEGPAQNSAPDSAPNPVPTPAPAKKPETERKVHALKDGPDTVAIKNLMDYLNDDELRGKYETEPQSKENATVVTI
jgi:hypothetical protein